MLQWISLDNFLSGWWPDQIGEWWCTNINYIHTHHCWLYQSNVLDDLGTWLTNLPCDMQHWFFFFYYLSHFLYYMVAHMEETSIYQDIYLPMWSYNMSLFLLLYVQNRLLSTIICLYSRILDMNPSFSTTTYS